MARTVPHQVAALDILDWIYFNQGLVFCVYTEQEQDCLYRLVEAVKAAVARTGATGLEAECLKHTVLCLMEIGLHDPIESLPTPKPIPLPAGLTREVHAEIAAYRRDYFMAMVIAVGRTARPLALDAAIGITNDLLGEFRAAPATVRYRLVERCLAFEHMAAPLAFFCWLMETGMIRSSKCLPEKARSSADQDTIVRIGLLCEFESIRHSMIALSRQQKAVEGLLPLADDLSARVSQQLLDNVDHYRRLAYAKNHRLILFDPSRIHDAAYVRQFLLDYRQICFRSRLVEGTQAKWMGMLGASIISLGKILVSPEKPIYVENNNAGSATEQVAALLLERGCTITPRTLYESYREFVEKICPRLRKYHAAQIRTGAAPPADCQDLFYNATIVLTSE